MIYFTNVAKNSDTAPFVRHAGLMFLALRAGDLVNLVAGMWLVPKFIAPNELGAVLPVTTAATLLALPLFAFGMTVTKESADLAGRDARGKLKSLWRGVFLGVALLGALSIAISAILLPRYLTRVAIVPSAAFIVLSAALLGAIAPVYTDALQAVKRFKALGAIEFLAALARLVVLAVAMPIRAFAGYFLGNAAQPLFRIAASIFALRHDLRVPAEPYWTRKNVRTLFGRFAFVLLYLAIPMVLSLVELDLIRHALPTADSAGYFIVTRLSDLMNYLTFPLVLVLFPYAADRTRKGESTLPLVARCTLVSLLAATLLGGIYALWGKTILGWIPTGTNYAAYLAHVPTLLAISALTASQTFYTNAEVASGRYGFLWWFIPTNTAYAFALQFANDPHFTGQETTLGKLLAWFLAGAVLRFACAAAEALLRRR